MAAAPRLSRKVKFILDEKGYVAPKKAKLDPAGSELFACLGEAQASTSFRARTSSSPNWWRETHDSPVTAH